TYIYIDDICPDLKGWELLFKENFFCSIDKRNKEVIKKHKGPMPFAMLLTRLYNHILATNPQAIGKKIASSPVISSSSSSSDDNEAPSFLEFYDELSGSEDLTKAQREKRGMFKCLNRYVPSPNT
ncbi:hypothetical protein Tco_0885694, partial [Tanacetum coccineum]